MSDKPLKGLARAEFEAMPWIRWIARWKNRAKYYKASAEMLDAQCVTEQETITALTLELAEAERARGLHRTHAAIWQDRAIEAHPDSSLAQMRIERDNAIKLTEAAERDLTLMKEANVGDADLMAIIGDLRDEKYQAEQRVTELEGEVERLRAFMSKDEETEYTRLVAEVDEMNAMLYEAGMGQGTDGVYAALRDRAPVKVEEGVPRGKPLLFISESGGIWLGGDPSAEMQLQRKDDPITHYLDPKWIYDAIDNAPPDTEEG